MMSRAVFVNRLFFRNVCELEIPGIIPVKQHKHHLVGEMLLRLDKIRAVQNDDVLHLVCVLEFITT